MIRAALIAAIALASIAPARAHAYLDPARFDEAATLGGAGGRSFTGAPADGYTCAVCHRGGAAPAIAIEGIPAEGWDPGATYELTLALPPASAGAAIEIADGAGSGVGLLAVVPEDELEASDRCGDASVATLPVIAGDRQLARTTVCGATRTRVRWTAPATARTDVRVFASVVAGNGSGDPSGDGAAHAALALRARGAPEVEGGRLTARCSIGQGGAGRSSGLALVVVVVLVRAWRARRRSVS